MTLRFSVVGLLRELIARAERDEDAELLDARRPARAGC